MTSTFSRAVGLVAIAAAITAVSSSARAAGFFVREHSTSGMASAFAGVSAGTGDASGLFYNPATIIDLPGNQLTLDGRIFVPEVDIEVDSATSLLGASSIRRGDSGNMAETAFAPSGFASFQIGDDTAIGLGFGAPFAVKIDTRTTWAGEFQLVKTEMVTWSVTPVIAHRLTDNFTVAVGLNYQHFEVDLRKTEILPITLPFVFAESPGYLKGDDESFGFVAGFLWQPHETTRIGVGYRSEVVHHVGGSAGVEHRAFAVQGAHFEIKTPQIVTIGLQHDLTDRLTLLGEAQWSEWSRFTGFDISFDSSQPNELRLQRWEDTWFFAGGLRYRWSDDTTVSAGMAVEDAITKGSTNTLSPDGRRLHASVGFTHDLTPTLSMSASYSHTWYRDADINISNTSGTLDATFHSDLDVFGVSFTHRW